MELLTAESDGDIAESGDAHAARHEIDLEKAEAGYRDLMAGYSGALAEASRLGRRGGDEVAEKLKDRQVSGGLVRLMLQAHVHNRLKELSAAYAQLAPALRSGEGSGRSWLDLAREDADRIVGALHGVRFRPLALLPIVVPVAAGLSSIPGWVGYLFLALSGGIVTFAWLGYMTLRESYLYKRELLLPNASKVDKRTEAEQRRAVAGNVYGLEDEAFAAIGRGKKPEAQVDRLIRAVALILLLEAMWLVPYAIWGERFFLETAIVVGLTFAGFWIRIRREKDRVWL